MVVRLVVLWLVLSTALTHAGVVEFHDNQLLVDGRPQPQLFGAELQYFRLRGGYGRNVPRAKVIELWARALDRMVEAKMNAISFYIPWDFHEYAEGRFDFTGTVDEDRDGKADYPSRDIHTFFKMIEERGIQHIMARPGPYINAEWGFLGFGAIPLWFHEKFPDSHMRNAAGLKTKLYDYHNPDLLTYSERWFKAVYEQVLAPHIGAGRPIHFMQLDNETNFMWQSIHNHDFGAPALNRYREFLKSRYADLAALNLAHQRRWASWEAIRAPAVHGVNLAEDQDWYRFQDWSIYTYLQKVRGMWERIGVREPTVLFTLAESYNALPHGLLPHYRYRNEPGKTGMMTVNLYPKTYDLPSRPLMNLPFKSDHDVKAADTASDRYLGKTVEWVFGPEIQGGWWKAIDVAEASRRQTYLTTLGHGMKALFIYYFHEGDNWQVEWVRDQVRPYHDRLKTSPAWANRAPTDQFWKDLQAQVDRELMVGLDVWGSLHADFDDQRELFFDAPLDRNAQPRDHYAGVKEVGVKLTGPHAEFLGKATAMVDDVCLLRDSAQHAPTRTRGVNSLIMNGEWMGGLLGHLLQLGVNPRIVHWGIDEEKLVGCKVVMRQDNAHTPEALSFRLRTMTAQGAMVINLLGDVLPQHWGSGIPATAMATNNARAASGMELKTLFSYDVGRNAGCRSVLEVNGRTVGYRCPLGTGTLVQIGAIWYERFNSDSYSSMSDVPAKNAFLLPLLQEAGIHPQLSFKNGGDRLAVFGRSDGTMKWVTVKNGREASVNFNVLVANLKAASNYRVTNLISAQSAVLRGDVLGRDGFPGTLAANGSTVFTVVPAGR